MPSSISAMTVSKVIMDMIARGSISSEFAPAVQLYFNGHLIALVSASGVVVYSTPRGDQILGSYYSTRGYELKHFLDSDEDVKKMQYFLSRLQREEEKEEEEREDDSYIDKNGSIFEVVRSR